MKKLLLISFVISLFQINVAHASCLVIFMEVSTKYFMRSPSFFASEPIHFAINTGNIKSLIALTKDMRSTTVMKFNKKGWTPLYLATSLNNLEAVKILLDAGMDPNIKNKDGKTALYVSTRGAKSLVIFKTLISYGASVNVRDKVGQTPLAYLTRVFKMVHSSGLGKIKILKEEANNKSKFRNHKRVELS